MSGMLFGIMHITYTISETVSIQSSPIFYRTFLILKGDQPLAANTGAKTRRPILEAKISKLVSARN